MFHFALHGMVSAQRLCPTVLSLGNDKAKSLYLILTAEYLCTFLPSHPDSIVLPQIVSGTVKVASPATVPVMQLVFNGKKNETKINIRQFLDQHDHQSTFCYRPYTTTPQRTQQMHRHSVPRTTVRLNPPVPTVGGPKVCFTFSSTAGCGWMWTIPASFPAMSSSVAFEFLLNNCMRSGIAQIWITVLWHS